MSHIATIQVEIRDLDCLRAAAKRLGLEWREGQQKYRWYGRSVGDYPLPTGFAAEDLGKCQHAIGVPGKADAYEVGVVARRDGKPGYTLLWDFWSGGHGLQDAVGQDGRKLIQAYAVEVARKQARLGGFVVSEQARADGSIKLVLRR